MCNLNPSIWEVQAEDSRSLRSSAATREFEASWSHTEPCLKTTDQAVVAAHAFNSSILEAQVGRSEFQASLVYRVNTVTVRTTQRNFVTKDK